MYWYKPEPTKHPLGVKCIENQSIQDLFIIQNWQHLQTGSRDALAVDQSGLFCEMVWEANSLIAIGL